MAKAYEERAVRIDPPLMDAVPHSAIAAKRRAAEALTKSSSASFERGSGAIFLITFPPMPPEHSVGLDDETISLGNAFPHFCLAGVYFGCVPIPHSRTFRAARRTLSFMLLPKHFLRNLRL